MKLSIYEDETVMVPEYVAFPCYLLHYHILTKTCSMEQSSWEADTHSAGQNKHWKGGGCGGKLPRVHAPSPCLS
jgi:hypothetical protein